LNVRSRAGAYIGGIQINSPLKFQLLETPIVPTAVNGCDALNGSLVICAMRI